MRSVQILINTYESEKFYLGKNKRGAEFVLKYWRWHGKYSLGNKRVFWISNHCSYIFCIHLEHWAYRIYIVFNKTVVSNWNPILSMIDGKKI